jgi:hypothetical protein
MTWKATFHGGPHHGEIHTLVGDDDWPPQATTLAGRDYYLNGWVVTERTASYHFRGTK